jgi:hypothetical protein
MVTAEVPADQKELARWLERTICSSDFNSLLCELKALHDFRPPPASFESTLDEVFDGKLADTLESGLHSVERVHLQRLLQRPWHLIALQREVFANGSEYWLSMIAQQPLPIDAEGQRTKIALVLSPDAVNLNRDDTPSSVGLSKRSIMMAVLSIFALSILAVVVMLSWKSVQRRNEQEKYWSWQADDFKPAANSSEYLHGLARRAEDWYSQSTDNASDLELRITQFRDGCDTIISSGHPSLSENDRLWLIARAQTWKSRCDSLIPQASAYFNTTKQLADALAAEVINELHQRAGG